MSARCWAGRGCVRKSRMGSRCSTTDAWRRAARHRQNIAVLGARPKSHRSPVFLGGRRPRTRSFAPGHRGRCAPSQILRPLDPASGEAGKPVSGWSALREPQRTRGVLVLQTGDEIGRLNYGTGDIPFVRTSDFGLGTERGKQSRGVSKEVWQEWQASQDAQAGDILLCARWHIPWSGHRCPLRDDLPLLSTAGGIYKIRCLDHERLPPGLLFALLNTAYARQMKNKKQFTRDVSRHAWSTGE